MHHKRRRPKNRRAGCLLCKPHKANGAKGRYDQQTLQERRARDDDQRSRGHDLPTRAVVS